MTTETVLRNALPSQQSSRLGVVAVVAVSVLAHGVAYGSLRALKEPQRRSPADEAPIFAPKPPKTPKRYVVEVERPAPPKRPAAAPQKPRQLERLKRRPVTKRAKPQKARPTPRAAKQVARKPQTQQQPLDLTRMPRAGVNAMLTSENGGEAFSVGSTAQGDPTAPPGKRPRRKGPVTKPAPTPAPAPTVVAKPAPVTIKRLPRVLKVPRVSYPKRAKDKRIQGTVKLKVTVGANGRVVRVKVLKGLGYGLDKAAVRALKRARFEPAVASNGSKVSYTIRYRYRFRLEQ